jgi:hypothetical protein
MNRSTVRSLSVVFAGAVVALLPLTAAAQPASTADMTADQVRADFQSLGYQVDTPTTWWTNNHVTTFTVSDRSDQGSASGRVLMVLVYPDTATAQSELTRAQAREAADNADLTPAAAGPHLVPGYGPSILLHNVALVESTQQELTRRYAAQLDRDNLAVFGTGQATEPTPAPAAAYAVDLDFLSALDNGIANL